MIFSSFLSCPCSSASGDSTVKIWNVESYLLELCNTSSARIECEAAETLSLGTGHSGHERDVYCVAYHAESSLVTSGGYDKTVRSSLSLDCLACLA